MAQTSPQMRLETVEPPHLSLSPGNPVADTMREAAKLFDNRMQSVHARSITD
jgi:hypothetical protein